MHIDFQQSGDPWHDWGLCELYRVLSDCDWPATAQVDISEPNDAGFSLSASITPEEFGRIVHRQLSSATRWNELHPRFQEGKKIQRCYPRIEAGRRVPGEKCDPKVSKEEWAAEGLSGNPPQNARNKCQRIANLPLTPSALATLLEPIGGKGSFEEIAANALQAGLTADVTQGANPVAAKHHSNGKVRGPSATNSARTETGLFLLPCFCASVSAWKPFVKDPVGACTVFLPENVPFERALRLWQHLRYSALIHPDDDKGDMYRNLPLRGDGEAAQLLVLINALQDRLTVREADILTGEELQELNDWVAINFSSGTNVSVGGIHRIEVPGSVFPLLKHIPMPEHWKSEGKVAFVPDCLVGVRVENVPMQSHIARALFHKDGFVTWRALEGVSFLLYKNVDQATKSTRSAARLLPHFFTHFAKELKIMTEDQLSACRSIGRLAGSAFSKDVTLLSRLHNCATRDDLRANLNVFAFRLMKVSNGPSDQQRGLWRIGADEFRAVLEMASTDEWQAAAQTISLFASLAAFNKNLGEGTPQS